MHDYYQLRMAPRTTVTYDIATNNASVETHMENYVQTSFIHTGFGIPEAPGVNTPGHFEKVVTIWPSGTLRWPNGGYQSGPLGIPLSSPADMPLSDPIYEAAIQKLYQELRKNIADLAVTVGERHETASLVSALRHPVSTIARYTRDLARTKKRVAAKVFADAVLTYKLAVAPLIGDITNICNAKLIENSTETHKVKVRKGQHLMHANKELISDGYWTRHVSEDNSKRVEIGISYTNSDPFLANASRLTGLNPLGVAWELIPLSFVVDRFYDVGGFLSALEDSVGLGLTFQAGYVTWSERSSSEQKFVATHVPGSQEGGYAIGNRTRTYKKRDILTSFPVPPIPSLKVPKSGSSFMLTAAALLATIL